jgi:N-acetyl-anhydromuramyl-L-alanine amidase AmpD
MREHTTLPFTQMPNGRAWNGVDGNFDTSRLPITQIIIHSTAGGESGSAAWFNNPASRVSAHYMICQDGRILAFVPEYATAYHSGKYSVNQSSIGIEFVDNGDNQSIRPDVMYAVGAKLIADICSANNITVSSDSIKRHRDIVSTACPGTLDVERLIRQAQPVPVAPQEQLHDYQILPSVFTKLVTEAGEFKDLWVKLGFPEDQVAQVGNHTRVIELFQNKLAEARAASNSPVAAAPAGAEGQGGPSFQAKSVWKTDIKDLLVNILNAVKGGKSAS